jgi:uncharacterized protein (TIGR02266 family)
VDVELSRAEAELQSEEAALHAELTRLASVSAELTDRLGVLEAKAQAAGDAAIAERASSVAIPGVDPNGAFHKAKAAREAAVRARRETNAAVRQQAAALKAQLQKLAAQTVADEKALVAAQERARQAAAVQAPVAPPPPPMRTVPQAAAVVAAAPAAKKPPARQSPRVKMQAAVDFHSDNNFFNGFSANISDGGLFVATVNLVPLGTEVDLSFSLPSGERIEAKGVVRWVREVNDKLPDAFPGLGVQFSSLKPEAQQAIDSFLAQRDPLFYAEAD